MGPFHSAFSVDCHSLKGIPYIVTSVNVTILKPVFLNFGSLKTKLDCRFSLPKSENARGVVIINSTQNQIKCPNKRYHRSLAMDSSTLVKLGPILIGAGLVVATAFFA